MGVEPSATSVEKIAVTLATELSFNAARDSVVERDLVAKTAEQYVAQGGEALRRLDARPGTSVVDGTAWVIGLVVGPDGKPLAGVKWAVFVATSAQTGDVASGETGTDGIFAYCRLTLGDDVVIRFTRRGMAPGFVTRFLGERLTVIHPQMSEEKRR